MKHTSLAAVAASLTLLAISSAAMAQTADSALSVAAVAERAQSALFPTQDPEAWKVVHYDTNPAVRVGQHAGHRVVLSYETRDLHQADSKQQIAQGVNSQQRFAESAPALAERRVELVLFPEPIEPPADLKTRIPWSGFDSDYHIEAVAMGSGLGYHWFGRLTLWMQDDLREQLDLEGGDNRARLAVDGLLESDPGNMTLNSMVARMDRHGDEAVHVIAQMLETGDYDDPHPLLRGLGAIHTEASTRLLCACYSSEDEGLKKAAAYALAYKPYRETAREAYLAMLESGQYTGSAAEACAAFGWTGAVPLINDRYSRASSAHKALELLRHLRTLEGNPIPEALFEAKAALGQHAMPFRSHLFTLAEVNQAIHTLASPSDTDAAVLIGLSMYMQGKAPDALKDSAVGVLEQLPEGAVKAHLNRLLENAEADSNLAGEYGRLMEALEVPADAA